MRNKMKLFGQYNRAFRFYFILVFGIPLMILISPLIAFCMYIESVKDHYEFWKGKRITKKGMRK